MAYTATYEMASNSLNVIGQAIRSRRVRFADIAAIRDVVKKMVALVFVVVILFGFVFGIAPMKGGDMQPKLAAGDMLFYYRLAKDYARNEVVVVQRDGAQYVGRIVGMPKETIEISSDRKVLINGVEIIETGIFFDTQAFQENVQYPLTLASDEYFILGDNRESAQDSRYFGPVKKEECTGKIIATLKRNDM